AMAAGAAVLVPGFQEDRRDPDRDRTVSRPPGNPRADRPGRSGRPASDRARPPARPGARSGVRAALWLLRPDRGPRERCCRGARQCGPPFAPTAGSFAARGRPPARSAYVRLLFPTRRRLLAG